MIRGTMAICKDCKNKKPLFVKDLCRGCYDNKNRNRIRQKSSKWRAHNPEKMIESREKSRFGGNVQAVLERDNFQCQDCGMTQEQHIIIFGVRLLVHHKDGEGRRKDNPNNDIDNLIAMCKRCHQISHIELDMKEKWGDLIEQDDSIWEYPKIRYLVEAEIRKGSGVQESKRIVSQDTGMSFTLIDHRYYKKKCAVHAKSEETK